LKATRSPRMSGCGSPDLNAEFEARALTGVGAEKAVGPGDTRIKRRELKVGD
jgi:hypothetical protein